MTCHCGNCEDHKPDVWTWYDLEHGKHMRGETMDNRDGTVSPDGGIPGRHVNLIARVQGNNTFLQVWEGEKHIKEFKTGIGANEMAFFFEDMVIPFRDMFEGLGFSVTEEVYIGE